MSLLTILRPATLHDCDALHRAHKHAVQFACIKSYTPEILIAWEALLDMESYHTTMADPGKALWIAEYRGAVQGFFQIDFKEAQLDALYVHPLAHNRGLGTALLQRAEDLVRDAGLSFLKLYASLNSVPFYRLNGYESLGTAVLPLNKSVQAECELMRKYL